MKEMILILQWQEIVPSELAAIRHNPYSWGDQATALTKNE